MVAASPHRRSPRSASSSATSGRERAGGELGAHGSLPARRAQFPSSSQLGAAYGIAVTGTMAITTVLFSHRAEPLALVGRPRRRDRRPLPRHRPRLLRGQHREDRAFRSAVRWVLPSAGHLRLHGARRRSRIVRRCCRDLAVEPDNITYYLGRARLVAT